MWRMEERVADALAADGAEAFDRGEAEASRLAFEEALAEGESATLLEGLARALYLEPSPPTRRSATRSARPARHEFSPGFTSTFSATSRSPGVGSPAPTGYSTTPARREWSADVLS